MQNPFKKAIIGGVVREPGTDRAPSGRPTFKREGTANAQPGEITRLNPKLLTKF